MKRRSDEEISAPLYAFDAEVRSQYGCFAGVDEAGRGPLCGPVCVAACILDPENPVFGINDSKKLTEKKREALFDEIIEKALAYKIVFVWPEIIDRVSEDFLRLKPLDFTVFLPSFTKTPSSNLYTLKSAGFFIFC